MMASETVKWYVISWNLQVCGSKDSMVKCHLHTIWVVWGVLYSIDNELFFFFHSTMNLRKSPEKNDTFSNTKYNVKPLQKPPDHKFIIFTRRKCCNKLLFYLWWFLCVIMLFLVPYLRFYHARIFAGMESIQCFLPLSEGKQS